jgi:hypothetical protein
LTNRRRSWQREAKGKSIFQKSKVGGQGGQRGKQKTKKKTKGKEKAFKADFGQKIKVKGKRQENKEKAS